MLLRILDIVNMLNPTTKEFLSDHNELVKQYLNFLPMCLLIMLMHNIFIILIKTKYNLLNSYYLSNNTIASNIFYAIGYILGLMLMIIPVITEEYIFRYLILEYLKYLSINLNLTTMVICSLLFSMTHISNYFLHRSIPMCVCQCIFVFFLSCLLYKINNLNLAILLHYTYNVSSMLIHLLFTNVYLIINYFTGNKKVNKSCNINIISTSIYFNKLKKSKSTNEIINLNRVNNPMVKITTKNKDILKMYDHKLFKKMFNIE